MSRLIDCVNLHISVRQPPPQKLLPEHAQTLERYAWESFDSHSQGKVYAFYHIWGIYCFGNCVSVTEHKFLSF